jgi:hypothetical protein
VITRAEARDGPKYQVSYRVNDQITISKAFTKEQNDQFAAAMELMGVTDIIKSFYNPIMGEWFRYHNTLPEEDHLL